MLPDEISATISYRSERFISGSGVSKRLKILMFHNILGPNIFRIV